MNSTHRIAVVLACALVLTGPGCTSTQPRRADADYRAALLAAITHIERTTLSPRSPTGPPAPLTLVVSSAIPEALRQACRALRPTVYDYDLPNTDVLSLPSGHLQPLSLAINGDTAVFKGVLGPVPLPGTPTARNDCGTTFQIRLLREPDRSWRSVGGSTEFCTLYPRRRQASAA